MVPPAFFISFVFFSIPSFNLLYLSHVSSQMSAMESIASASVWMLIFSRSSLYFSSFKIFVFLYSFLLISGMNSVETR